MNLREYIALFNAEDKEYCPTDIDNAECEEWLENEIPKLECSDKDTERTYYFRWWVYRKHLKKTPEGFVVTEFLPDVPWSGKYNVINAAAGHHIMEGRWLKNADIYLNDYICFLLNHAHEGTQYSSFTLWATKEFHAVTGKADIPAFLPKAKALYADFEREHGTEIGLFWSIDGYDAMEFSLSGSPDGAPIKGIRPTLNSYMYGAAKAIDAFSQLSGESSSEYGEKAEKISADIKNILWRDGFFKALHPRDGDFKKVPTMETADIPRELIGYIPFVFSIPGGRYDVFSLLEDRSVFLAKEGLTTVDRGFPGFL